MPRNVRRPALETRRKTFTLCLRLPKPPVPVPDNDEMEEVDEDDIETQSEDHRYPLIPTPERIPTPEPDISYRLYERVIINGIKDPLKTKYRTVSIHDPAISICSIKYTAKRMAEEYVAKQNCKAVELADHIAIISSNKRGSPVKIKGLERDYWSSEGVI
ncbi:hypothetical protein ACJ73_07522 [Blastomyces percursus]|uniref:Uncharacterized protein n=1 Tax=Blastomyces percursus TaxID=1658174 RepID=A0A1J9QZ79_9EURO|nr:hypothetical protein ACJ73_07522 [Blastomyces percursus]